MIECKKKKIKFIVYFCINIPVDQKLKIEVSKRINISVYIRLYFTI